MSILYKHVVEIGAGDRHSSEALKLCDRAERVTLYEPNQLLCDDLMEANHYPVSKIAIHRVAVGGLGGDRVELFHMGYASWVLNVPSFMATSCEPEGFTFLEPLLRSVPSLDAAEAVGEDVDLLILTCNGSERFCLESLDQHKRFPRQIRTAHYIHNGKQSAEAQAVWAWFQMRGYRGEATETNQHRTFYRVSWHLPS